jgi:hypothetical protein
MGNKQASSDSSPTSMGGASWASVAKATQDVRLKEQRGLTGEVPTNVLPEIKTSAAKLPANLQYSSLAYINGVLTFDLIASEECVCMIFVDDSKIKDRDLIFDVGKHKFQGELELTPANKLLISIKSNGSEEERALKVTCRLKGDRLIILAKQALLADSRVVDLEEVYGLSNAKECVICITELCNTTFIPCRHMCACEDCASFLMTMKSADRRCPVCRTLISSSVKLKTDG